MTFTTTNFGKPNKGAPRPPLMTLRELSQEVGVSMPKLKHLVMTYKCPKPTFYATEYTGAHKCSQYPAKALRAWWETVKDKV